MWTWRQKTGELLNMAGVVVARGYSGHGVGKNNPVLQATRSVGPIPAGYWRICGMIPRYGTHGPYVLRLVPERGTETHGRAGFLIHGDSISEPGEASLGCIILPRPVREVIWESGDQLLLVVSGAPEVVKT